MRRRLRPPGSHPAGRRGADPPDPCGDGDQLWAYLDGELTAAGARAVARHVASCQACDARARRLRTMLETCRAAGCRQLPADVRARARERVRALLTAARQKA